ncbi:MAG: Lrp/AsnC family transcriptional regulator [Synergistaceae bacterium]|nr:Lrp/AsnC family transcriptional regulator [Synergistaceae bacterium]
MGRNRIDSLDNTGWKILDELQKNSRISYKDLAHKVGLSCSPLIERIKRMEEDGLIKNYTAVLDTQMMGFVIIAIIELRYNSSKDEEILTEIFLEHPSVLQYWITTGDNDFILETIFPSVHDMNTFLVFLAKYGQTRSYIILEKSLRKPISKESICGDTDKQE